MGGVLRNQRVLLPGRENQRGAYELAVRRYVDGEAFLTSESVDRLAARAKARGLWGLASKVKVTRSGNSWVVRIPAPLARYLKLKQGQDVLVAPDHERQVVLELA